MMQKEPQVMLKERSHIKEREKHIKKIKRSQMMYGGNGFQGISRPETISPKNKYYISYLGFVLHR